MRWHSFCTPAVVLNRCAVLLDHNNAQVSWKYGTARAGLNFALKKYKFCMVFAQNSCLTTITLLRGPNIIIWSHVLCQVHHPFNIEFAPQMYCLALCGKRYFWSREQPIYGVYINWGNCCLWLRFPVELGACIPWWRLIGWWCVKCTYMGFCSSSQQGQIPGSYCLT